MTDRTAAALTELIDSLLAGYDHTEVDEAAAAAQVLKHVEAAQAHHAMACALPGATGRKYSTAAAGDLAKAKAIASSIAS